MSFQNKLFKYESKLNNLQKGGSPLIDAIRANNLEEVRKLLTETPALINQNFVAPNGRYNFPIFNAWKSIEMIKLLMEFKADINIKDERGNTMLYNEIRALDRLVRDVRTAVLTLESRIYNREYSNPEELNSLRENVDYSRMLLRNAIDVVEFLIKNGAEYNITEGNRENTDNLIFGYFTDEIKAGVILPLLATQLEKFNFKYRRYSSLLFTSAIDQSFLEYIIDYYRIRPEEIMEVAGKMGADRRVHALSALLAARKRRADASAAATAASSPSAASAAAAVSAPPANAGAGNL